MARHLKCGIRIVECGMFKDDGKTSRGWEDAETRGNEEMRMM